MAEASFRVLLGAGMVFSIAVALSTPALAQDGDGSQAGVFEDAQVESSAPGENLDEKIAGLRWGVAISTVAIPLGVGLFSWGAAGCIGNSLVGQDCSAGENAAVWIGMTFMIAGTAGMITTAILLRRRKRERQGLHAERRLRWSLEEHRLVF